MLLVLLSPVSILVGVVMAVAAIAILWPLNGLGATIGIMAFAIGAGMSELVRRLMKLPKSTAPASSEGRAAPPDAGAE